MNGRRVLRRIVGAVLSLALLASGALAAGAVADSASAGDPEPTPLATNKVFNPVAPSRSFDTRDGTGGVPVGRIPGGQFRQVQVTGRNGIPGPDQVAAVALNVTVTGATAPGFITVYPCGLRPLASSLNYHPGQTVPNAVVAPVSAGGTVCFYAEGETHLLADVSGWFAAGVDGFATLNSPSRLFDTRTGAGGVPTVRVASGGTLQVQVAGVHGIPPNGVAAVAMNVTATSTTGAGFVTVYPCGPPPHASNLNYLANQTVPNLVIAPVAANGTVCFYVETAAHLLADVSAWFSSSGTGTFQGLTPTRAADTRAFATATANALSGSMMAEPYVTGGSSINISQAPWQVYLYVDTGQGGWECGGVMVHQSWVLTAAHCVEGAWPSWFSVHAGITAWTDMNAFNAMSVQQVIMHPQYDDVQLTNDIALLQLSSPAVAGTPIMLNYWPSVPAYGTPAVVSGWGLRVGGYPESVANQLYAADLTVLSGPDTVCNTNYPPGLLVASAHICAQGDPNAGACNGDSGGPLTMQASARAILIGVVSWGDSECWNSPAYPSVFTRVATYAPWISQWVPDMRKIWGGKIQEVHITGKYGVPPSGVAGVSLNLTVTGTEASGFATVYPCGAVPGTSTINFRPGQARANGVITPLSASGKVCVYATSPLHAVIDVNGWFPA